jgi:hypothetical protein
MVYHVTIKLQFSGYAEELCAAILREGWITASQGGTDIIISVIGHRMVAMLLLDVVRLCFVAKITDYNINCEQM